MRMSEDDFIKLFNKFDKTWVGSEDHVYSYQKKYTRFFKGAEEVVEIACGQGAFLRALREDGINGIGVDLDNENVITCLNKGYSALNNDAFLYLDEHPDQVGGIFMAHLIEHFDSTMAIMLIVSCYEALSVGGRLVIITPNFYDEFIHKESFWLSSSHIRPYPKRFLENVFNIMGFKIIESGYDEHGGDTYIVGEK